MKVGKIISSEWCRGEQTAELMNIGPVEIAPTFNNAFVLNATRETLTAGVRAIVGAWRGPGTMVVVTHGRVFMFLGIFRKFTKRLNRLVNRVAGFAMLTVRH